MEEIKGRRREGWEVNGVVRDFRQRNDVTYNED